MVVNDGLINATERNGIVQESWGAIAGCNGVVEFSAQIEVLATRIVQRCNGIIPTAKGPIDDPIGATISPSRKVDHRGVAISFHAVLSTTTVAAIHGSRTDRGHYLNALQGEARREIRTAGCRTHSEAPPVVAIGRCVHSVTITEEVHVHPVLVVPQALVGDITAHCVRSESLAVQKQDRRQRGQEGYK